MTCGTRQYDGIDIAKAILCVFIMLIHLNPFRGGENCIYPIVRIAVPLFFVFSSYFFFSKITFSWVQDKAIVKRFVLRNLKLYAFWFVVLLPHTIQYKHYYELRFLGIFETMPRDIFFASTFGASWFIMALIEGMLIVYCLRKIIPQWAIVALSFLFYLFCCMYTNYYGIFFEFSWFQYMVNLYPLPANIPCCFMSAMLWLSIGMYVAEREKKRAKCILSNSYMALWITLSLLVLYAEQYVINRLGCSSRSDCYLTLAPLVIVLFIMVKQWNVSCRCARFMRKYSTIAYCSHVPCGFVCAIILRKIFLITDCHWLVFLLAVASTILLTYVITRLEKVPHLTWLKYAH